MPTIGEQLKQAREARSLTIKQAVQTTRVRAHYLQAMEADNFSAMPSAAQARGFLRLYAEFLALNADELIDVYRAEANPGSATLPPIAPNPPKQTPAPEPQITLPVTVLTEEPALPQAQNSLPEPARLSQTILSEIGLALHERRELISITLDEIERHTHVRKHNLELIETGNFDELPSPVQARGILSTYASFLDMDTDGVLLRYADALQARRVEHQADETIKHPSRRTHLAFPMLMRRFISPDLIFGGGMIIILLALSIWGAARIFSGSTQTQTTPTTGPSISDVLLESTIGAPRETEVIPTSVEDLAGLPGLTLEPTLATEAEITLTSSPSAIKVTIAILERTFLRVTVDGEVKYEGRAAPGAALSFDANERIEVLVGSGAAVQIIYNQSDMGIMGSFGEVVNRIYTINGIETPTPTASPTPTITPIPSATPKPSLTPRPTSSPRPTSTLRPTSTPRPSLTPTQ